MPRGRRDSAWEVLQLQASRSTLRFSAPRGTPTQPAFNPKSGACGGSQGPLSCSLHVCPGLRQPLPSISGHQAFISFQATRNVKFPFCAGASSVLSVIGLCICYSFTITLMGSLEEREINKTVQSTATPSSPENWAVTKCEAAALDLSGKDSLTQSLLKNEATENLEL